MKTKSEEVFESFLTLNNIPFKRIEEVQESGSRRPDYSVQVGNCELIFEVKELVEDEKFGIVSDPLHPDIKLSSRTVGKHVRRAIARARKQIQWGARQGIPSILLIYNSLDPVFQDFGTADLDFISAMYGEPTVEFDRSTRKTSEPYNGRNDSLQESKNTSFSAVGRLAEKSGKVTVTLFENVFAEPKLPYDQLPPCIEVRRVEVSRDPLSFA